MQPVALKLRRGGINWEPPFPEGEDEVSLKRHKEWLQNECMRRTPDLKRVAERMSLTFPDRRRLMNKNVPLTEVRAEYPALFDFKQVLCSFFLIKFLLLIRDCHTAPVAREFPLPRLL